MKISEMFFSLQGEGKRTGVPSFFIRTNYCNLRCKFSSGNLCDTAYTSWNPEDKMNIGEVDVNKILENYGKFYPSDIVITGGEPVIQAKELEKLFIEIINRFKNIFITIETNGTYFPEFLKSISLQNNETEFGSKILSTGIHLLFSISPKLKSSVPFGTEYEILHEKHRINIKSLEEYRKLSDRKNADIQWKFVISSEDDVNEILELKKSLNIASENIYLMPEGITENEILMNSRITAELCLKYKFNYSDRLHIRLWGNKRGV